VGAASVSSETNENDQAGGAERDSEQGVHIVNSSGQESDRAKDPRPGTDDTATEEEANVAGCAAGSESVSRCY
jgi:hypothetical protein